MPINESDRWKQYAGIEFGCPVLVRHKGRVYELPHILRHSPDGFAWGYEGSGPADLALAILTDLAGEDVADKHYEEFKRQIIADLPERKPWKLGASAILAWLAFHGAMACEDCGGPMEDYQAENPECSFKATAERCGYCASMSVPAS